MDNLASFLLYGDSVTGSDFHETIGNFYLLSQK